MHIQKLSSSLDIKRYLQKIGVDGGGLAILAAKAKQHIIYIQDLHVGAANILKQDALSVGADLAVPKGTVIATTPQVDCILLATQRELALLSKKELSQPFGLKMLAQELQKIVRTKPVQERKIMGVLNANDDSFFKASRFKATEARVKIEKMIEEGADIIDIGGVSSRPNASVVSVAEELARVENIYALIAEEKLYEKVQFSCDSYAPSVIEKALDSGFSIVNDITGLADDAVCKLCASYDAQAVIMHMQGTPQTMQNNPHYESVLNDIKSFFEQRIAKAESFGVKDIVLDVGIGFGKTLADNLQLIKHLEHFLHLEKPLLVGASRKSMIDKIFPSVSEDRLAGTLALHLEALKNGASILRVHDVYEHKQALSVYEALAVT